MLAKIISTIVVLIVIAAVGTIPGWWSGNPMLGLQTVGVLVGSFLLTFIAVWEGSQRGIGPIISIARNHIVTVDKGKGNPTKMLANLPPGYVVKGMEIVKGDPSWNPFASFLRSFGLFYKGWPPLEVHEFPFLHERINPSLNEEKPEEWIERDKAPVPTRHLLWDKQHDFMIPGVEFKGGMSANIMINARFLSKRPLVSIYDREGKFFDVMKPIIHGAVIGIASLKVYKEEFSEANSKEREAFTESVLEFLRKNDLLVSQTGQEMMSLVISRHKPVTKEQEKLLLLKEEAKIRRQAAIIDAQADTADVTEMIKAVKRQLKDAKTEQVIELVRDLAVATRMKEAGSQAMNVGAMLGMGLSNNKNSPGGKGPGRGGRRK
ncbi:MAG: hypothetical protein V4690_04280 [Patescibacteria group bacterium]